MGGIKSFLFVGPRGGWVSRDKRGVVTVAGGVAIFAERVGSEFHFSRRHLQGPVDARAALSHDSRQPSPPRCPSRHLARWGARVRAGGTYKKPGSSSGLLTPPSRRQGH